MKRHLVIGLVWMLSFAEVAFAREIVRGPMKAPEPLSVKQLRQRYMLAPDVLAAAQAAVDRARSRFDALATDGAAADVQLMPDGMVMVLGRNEYRAGDGLMSMREIRSNYEAVGNQDEWCFLRAGESLWQCAKPGQLRPGLVDVDWLGVTRVRWQDEACGAASCRRLLIDGLVVVDDAETSPKKRRYHPDVNERAFTVTLLLDDEGTARELVRVDRMSRQRAANITLKFDWSADVAPIVLPPEEKRFKP